MKQQVYLQNEKLGCKRFVLNSEYKVIMIYEAFYG